MQYIDNLIVEQTLTQSARVEALTSTVTASGTLALTSASTMAQVFTGSTLGQILKLPDATTLAVGQKYEIYNGSSASVAVQDGSANPLFTLQANQLGVLRLLSVATAAGAWAYNAIDQSMSAADELLCAYGGTGLSISYQPGIVYLNGTEYSIAAGSIALSASITGGFVYVDPTAHVVAQGASLPNNAVAMATFNTSASAVTALNDAREFAGRNLVWGLTADILAQTSQSTASGGSLEKYARADHKHAMNINLMKSGVVAGGSFSGNPKTAAVAFGSAFADTAYSIHLSSTDGRTFIYSSKTASGFTISAQANQAIIGEVSWIAIKSGEST